MRKTNEKGNNWLEVTDNSDNGFILIFSLPLFDRRLSAVNFHNIACNP